MKRSSRRLRCASAPAIGSACLALGSPAVAQTTQTFGQGSAVTRSDRLASFDSLTYDGISLSDYVEDEISIGVNGDSLVGFDPFHGADGATPTFQYPDGGSDGWVTIRAVHGWRIGAVEFMYGNGWTTGDVTWPWGNHDAYLEWQTWANGVLVSSGTVGASGQPVLEMGTILGFADPSGFDQLLVRSLMPNGSPPDWQALALDSVNVQSLYLPALWTSYGNGWSGTLGVPTLMGNAEPVLGTSVSFNLTNSAGFDTLGLIVVGLAEANLDIGRGGTLLVDPLYFLLESIPVSDLVMVGQLPPFDPALCGVEINLQAIELDPGASKGLSFTRGSKLILGV